MYLLLSLYQWRKADEQSNLNLTENKFTALLWLDPHEQQGKMHRQRIH
jgi:hypothetical protein